MQILCKIGLHRKKPYMYGGLIVCVRCFAYKWPHRFVPKSIMKFVDELRRGHAE